MLTAAPLPTWTLSAEAEVVEWQTRSTQNALPARACGFKSRLRHREPPAAATVDDSKAGNMSQTAESTRSLDGQRRVLVAEDEALIRLDLAEMLGEAGYHVVGQASNGQQAVELAQELKP